MDMCELKASMASVERQGDEKMEKLEQLEVDLVEMFTNLKSFLDTQSQTPTKQLLPVPPVTAPVEKTQKELSPNIKAKIRKCNFESIGGQRIRCLLCQHEMSYHSIRVREHKCKAK